VSAQLKGTGGYPPSPRANLTQYGCNNNIFSPDSDFLYNSLDAALNLDITRSFLYVIYISIAMFNRILPVTRLVFQDLHLID